MDLPYSVRLDAPMLSDATDNPRVHDGFSPISAQLKYQEQLELGFLGQNISGI